MLVASAEEADEVAEAAAEAAALSTASFISESGLVSADKEAGAGNVGKEPTNASGKLPASGRAVGAEVRVDEDGDESSPMGAETFCAAPAAAALLCCCWDCASWIGLDALMKFAF